MSENEIEIEVRRALLEMVGHGRPVPLGRRALARVRRQRQQRAAMLTAVSALVLATIAVPQLLGRDTRPGQPASRLAGRNLVAAYLTSTDVRVLNPETGRYRTTGMLAEALSPDFRFAAGTRLASYVQTYPVESPKLGILDTRTGDLDWIGMPHPIKDPAWSPAGGYIVARIVDQGPARAVLVKPAQAETEVVALGIPPDRFLVRLCWSDADHLLAVTLPPVGEPAPPTQDLIVLDRTGAEVRTITIPDSWAVHCAGRRGRVVVTRLTQPVTPAATVVPPEAAIVDLASGAVGTPVRLPWAGVIEPLAWRSDSSFVAFSQKHTLVVDLGLGTVTQVGDMPGEPSHSMVLSTEGLRAPIPDAVAEAAF